MGGVGGVCNRSDMCVCVCVRVCEGQESVACEVCVGGSNLVCKKHNRHPSNHTDI